MTVRLHDCGELGHVRHAKHFRHVKRVAELESTEEETTATHKLRHASWEQQPFNSLDMLST